MAIDVVWRAESSRPTTREAFFTSNTNHAVRLPLIRLAFGQPPRVKEEVISSDCPPDSQTPRGRLTPSAALGGSSLREGAKDGGTDSSACGLRMTGKG